LNLSDIEILARIEKRLTIEKLMTKIKIETKDWNVMKEIMKGY